MRWNPYPRRGSVIGIALCAILPAAPSRAATIHVPPLIVTSLQHVSTVPGQPAGFVRDAISIPETTCGRGCCYWLTECEGTGYTSHLFNATISAGDVVTVRIEAPAGKKFVVHAPAGGSSAYFWASVYWHSGKADYGIVEPHTVTFENLAGTPPSETYSFVGTGTGHGIVMATEDYVYTTAFEFTAFRVDIAVASQEASAPLTYKILGSWSDPSFGASGMAATDHAPIMEIADIATPAERTSWGRIKTLYR